MPGFHFLKSKTELHPQVVMRDNLETRDALLHSVHHIVVMTYQKLTKSTENRKLFENSVNACHFAILPTNFELHFECRECS